MEKFVFLSSDETGQAIWLLSLEGGPAATFYSDTYRTQKLPKNVSLKSLF